MAYLDLSDAVCAPDLTDRFVVQRRLETVGVNGRSSVTPATYVGVLGVVTAASANDLERLPEEDRMGRNLSIVTRFRLQGPTVGFKPDVVIWRGDSYLVKSLDPYPQFGSGFYQAIVGSLDAVDQAFVPPAPGRVAFNQAAQSGEVACF